MNINPLPLPPVLLNSGVYHSDDAARSTYHYTHVERRPLLFLAVIREFPTRRRREEEGEVLAFINRVTAVLRLETLFAQLTPLS